MQMILLLVFVVLWVTACMSVVVKKTKEMEKKIEEKSEKLRAEAESVLKLFSASVTNDLNLALKEIVGRAIEMSGVGSGIALENKKFIEMIQNEFENEIMKANEERDEAHANFTVLTTAIRSLDLNYRKKIQFQLDLIIGKDRKEPFRKPVENGAVKPADESAEADLPAEPTPDRKEKRKGKKPVNHV